jgi:hypothetical protein
MAVPTDQFSALDPFSTDPRGLSVSPFALHPEKGVLIFLSGAT